MIEELGWDYHTGKVKTQIRLTGIDETEYLLTAIAEKRGMVVFLYSAIELMKVAFQIMRPGVKFKEQVAKSVHEHFIIYTDDATN